MAKEYFVRDDLDGTPGAETHKLTLDERSISIDLSSENYEKLTQALEPYFNAGTERTQNSTSDTAKVRAWLRANGHEISDKGRIPEDKLALYRGGQS